MAKRLRVFKLQVRVTQELYDQIMSTVDKEWQQLGTDKSSTISHAVRVLIGHGVHRYNEKRRGK